MSSYRYSSAANTDIEEIAQYIFESNPVAANRFLDSLERACELLSQHPLIGRARNEIGENLRSYPIGNYLIFYVPRPDGIDIARVIYGGRNLPAVFE